jgi:hypothetical protein
MCQIGGAGLEHVLHHQEVQTAQQALTTVLIGLGVNRIFTYDIQ